MTIVMFSTTSCDDDSGPVTNTQLITAGPWIFSSASTGDASLDIFVGALFTGFTLTFFADGTTTVVFPIDPSSSGSGTWRFNVEETQVVLDEGTIDEQTSDIVTLNTTTFVFTISEDFGGGFIPITITTTH